MFHFTDSIFELHILFNFKTIFVLSDHIEEYKMCFLAGHFFCLMFEISYYQIQTGNGIMFCVHLCIKLIISALE